MVVTSILSRFDYGLITAGSWVQRVEVLERNFC